MLYLNDVLEQAETGIRVRVICVDNEEESHPSFCQSIWLFNLADGNYLPEPFELSTVVENLEKGALLRLEGTLGRSLTPPSDAARAARDNAYERIKPLLEESGIRFKSERNRLIKARAAELKCSPQTLFSDLRRWWRNGQTRNALIPNFRTRGSTGGTTANRGRKPKYENRPIFQITCKEVEQILKILESKYLENDFETLAGAYQTLLENDYSYVDTEGERIIKASGEIPSIQQFRSIARKLLPQEMVIRRRKGDAEFELNHRPKLGSLQHQTYSAGDAYEIDATIADALLVFSRNRAAILGKPTLYLIFDRKTWLIVGFYIGLEPPSWPAAMQAILSITEDKEALCKRHGVIYDPADWPAHGILPKQFIADRGSENLSGNSNQIIDGLEVTVCNLPSKRADHKPHVECGFKLIQRSIANATPGYTPPENFAKRQGKHYDKDACLTLDEFKSIILNAIILFNRSPRDGYIWPAEHVLNGHQPIPREIWPMEIRKRAGLLSRTSEEQVRFALLPKDKATVSRDGIRLGACYYSCPEAINRGWMVAAQRATFRVSVSYDRRLVDSIYIIDDKDPTKFFIATLLDRCSDYRGLSFDEVAAIEHQRKVLKVKGEGIFRQNQSNFHQSVAPLTKEAHAEMKRLSKGKSRTSRKKDIKEIRNDERRLQRQEEANIAPPTHDAPKAELIHLPTYSTGTLAQTTRTDQRSDNLPSREQRQRQKRQEMLDGQ